MSKVNNNIVLITGIERSGASLIARIVSLCGGFFGVHSSMYESINVRKLIDEYYSNVLSLSSNLQYPIPEIEKIVQNDEWGDNVINALMLEGLNGSHTVCIKSPKICQTYPLWVNAFPEAKWIIVRRKTSEIVNSCIKTNYMKSYKDVQTLKRIGVTSEHDGWLQWARKHDEYFKGMVRSNINYMEVWPDRMVNGDYSQIFNMLGFIGLPWNDKIVETIDPLLFKSKKNKYEAV